LLRGEERILVDNSRRASGIGTVAVGFRLFLALLIFVGLVTRAAPLLDQEGRLMNAPNDDGYLMLTIARNLALGKGFTVSDGTTQTNGTQPLATLIEAGVFALVGGNRRAGVALILILQMIIACCAAIALRELGRRVLRARDDGKTIADLAAAVFFASPVTLRHTVNFQETGLYALVVVLAGLAVLNVLSSDRESNSYSRYLWLGALLGAAFWTRNDAVFLILATCLIVLFDGFREGGMRARGLLRAIIIGITSIVVAAPWLYFNYSRFGHIVPVSGRLEALGAGQSISVLPSVLVSYLLMISPIPTAIWDKPLVIAACLLLLVGAALVLARVWRAAEKEERRWMAWAGMCAAFFTLFYGFFFGATPYLPRFLFPISPFFALLWGVAVYRAWRWSRQRGFGRLAQVSAAALFAAAIGVHVRTYLSLREHLQLPVVRWVNQNVPEPTWIGSVLSGTLGFFHDRTINLDGNVNPAALQARLDGRIGEYMVESRSEYLVDGIGLRDYYRLPVIREHFELLVEDWKGNLAVMKRRRAL
jgi:Dolichyl-phosphate-mannose-protein mannosyltransferase